MLPLVTAHADSGRTLRIPLQYPPVSIDPARLIDTDGMWITAQLFEGLFAYAPGGGIRQQLVSKWWVTEYGKTYHFILRSDARFSDGMALTAADVKFTLERLLRLSPRERAFLQNITAVKLIDHTSFEIRLLNPAPNFLAALATPFYAILPMKYDSAMREGKFFHAPVGSGPYRIAAWDQQAIRLAPNPYYYQKPAWVSAITFQFLHGPRTLTRSELDQYDLLVGLPIETKLTLPHFVSNIYMHPAVEFIAFNLRDSFWNVKANRVTFTRIFNARKFYDVLFEKRQESWHFARSILPYGMRPNTVLDKEVSSETTPVAVVKSYLAQPERNILYFITHPHIRLEKLQRAVDAAMQESGLQILAKKATPDEVMRDSSTPRMGLIATQIMADVPDPYEVLVNFSPDAAINYSGYTGFTERLRAARNVAIPDERMRMYEQLARQLIDDRVVIPIASVLNEKLLVKEDLRLETLSQLGPWYYALNQITPQRMH